MMCVRVCTVLTWPVSVYNNTIRGPTGCLGLNFQHM